MSIFKDREVLMWTKIFFASIFLMLFLIALGTAKAQSISSDRLNIENRLTSLERTAENNRSDIDDLKEASSTTAEILTELQKNFSALSARVEILFWLMGPIGGLGGLTTLSGSKIIEKVRKKG